MVLPSLQRLAVADCKALLNALWCTTTTTSRLTSPLTPHILAADAAAAAAAALPSPLPLPPSPSRCAACSTSWTPS